MDSPTVSPGRIVSYVLNASDAAAISADERPSNSAQPGDEYPAIVVRVWSATTVQLQVFIDGAFTLWATSRLEGTGHGTWHWPERV